MGDSGNKITGNQNEKSRKSSSPSIWSCIANVSKWSDIIKLQNKTSKDSPILDDKLTEGDRSLSHNDFQSLVSVKLQPSTTNKAKPDRKLSELAPRGKINRQFLSDKKISINVPAFQSVTKKPITEDIKNKVNKSNSSHVVSSSGKSEKPKSNLMKNMSVHQFYKLDKIEKKSEKNEPQDRPQMIVLLLEKIKVLEMEIKDLQRNENTKEGNSSISIKDRKKSLSKHSQKSETPTEKEKKSSQKKKSTTKCNTKKETKQKTNTKSEEKSAKKSNIKLHTVNSKQKQLLNSTNLKEKKSETITEKEQQSQHHAKKSKDSSMKRKRSHQKVIMNDDNNNLQENVDNVNKSPNKKVLNNVNTNENNTKESTTIWLLSNKIKRLENQLKLLNKSPRNCNNNINENTSSVNKVGSEFVIDFFPPSNSKVYEKAYIKTVCHNKPKSSFFNTIEIATTNPVHSNNQTAVKKSSRHDNKIRKNSFITLFYPDMTSIKRDSQLIKFTNNCVRNDTDNNKPVVKTNEEFGRVSQSLLDVNMFRNTKRKGILSRPKSKDNNITTNFSKTSVIKKLEKNTQTSKPSIYKKTMLVSIHSPSSDTSEEEINQKEELKSKKYESSPTRNSAEIEYDIPTKDNGKMNEEQTSIKTGIPKSLRDETKGITKKNNKQGHLILPGNDGDFNSNKGKEGPFNNNSMNRNTITNRLNQVKSRMQFFDSYGNNRCRPTVKEPDEEGKHEIEFEVDRASVYSSIFGSKNYITAQERKNREVANQQQNRGVPYRYSYFRKRVSSYSTPDEKNSNNGLFPCRTSSLVNKPPNTVQSSISNEADYKSFFINNNQKDYFVNTSISNPSTNSHGFRRYKPNTVLRNALHNSPYSTMNRASKVKLTSPLKSERFGGSLKSLSFSVNVNEDKKQETITKSKSLTNMKTVEDEIFSEINVNICNANSKNDSLKVSEKISKENLDVPKIINNDNSKKIDNKILDVSEKGDSANVDDNELLMNIVQLPPVQPATEVISNVYLVLVNSDTKFTEDKGSKKPNKKICITTNKKSKTVIDEETIKKMIIDLKTSIDNFIAKEELRLSRQNSIEKDVNVNCNTDDPNVPQRITSKSTKLKDAEQKLYEEFIQINVNDVIKILDDKEKPLKHNKSDTNIKTKKQEMKIENINSGLPDSQLTDAVVTNDGDNESNISVDENNNITKELNNQKSNNKLKNKSVTILSEGEDNNENEISVVEPDDSITNENNLLSETNNNGDNETKVENNSPDDKKKLDVEGEGENINATNSVTCQCLTSGANVCFPPLNFFDNSNLSAYSSLSETEISSGSEKSAMLKSPLSSKRSWSRYSSNNPINKTYNHEIDELKKEIQLQRREVNELKSIWSKCSSRLDDIWKSGSKSIRSHINSSDSKKSSASNIFKKCSAKGSDHQYRTDPSSINIVNERSIKSVQNALQEREADITVAFQNLAETSLMISGILSNVDTSSSKPNSKIDHIPIHHLSPPSKKKQHYAVSKSYIKNTSSKCMLNMKQNKIKISNEMGTALSTTDFDDIDDANVLSSVCSSDQWKMSERSEQTKSSTSNSNIGNHNINAINSTSDYHLVSNQYIQKSQNNNCVILNYNAKCVNKTSKSCVEPCLKKNNKVFIKDNSVDN